METPTFSSAGTILTQVRAKTRIGANPTSTALQNDAMYLQLSDINDWAVNYPYTIGMLGWKFLSEEAIIQTKVNTTLHTATAVGDATMVLTNGTNFDNPPITPDYPGTAGGYIRTGREICDFFTYEGITGNTISLLAGLQMPHLAGEEVHKIYPLPMDMGKIRSIFRMSNVIEYQYLDQDLRQLPPFGYYMLKQFTDSQGIIATFIVFPRSIGTLDFKVNYIRKSTGVSVAEGMVDLPDGDGRQVLIEKLCEYVWGILGEDNLAIAAAKSADDHMQNLLGKWSMPTASTSQSVQLLW